MLFNASSPMARGRLSSISVAELLVLSLDRRLNGSFVFEAKVSGRSALVVASGHVTKLRTAEPIHPLGRLLTESGVIDHATLEQGLRLAHAHKDLLGDALIQLDAVDRRVLDTTLREQLERRLSWLGQLPEDSAYGFYANVDLLEDRPVCGADPLGVIWRCIRDGQGRHPRQEAVLSALGTRPLRLAPGAALERFELPASVHACFQHLRARPLELDALIARTGLEPAQARRSIYALLMTRQLEPLSTAGAPLTSPPPDSSAERTPTPARRGSSPPPTPDRVEHALQRASRVVRERTRAEGAAEALRAVDAASQSIARKKYAEAEALVHQACSADPGNAEYMALHAWLRMQNGELAVPALAAQIATTLDRAVMKAPSSVPVRLYRAQVLKRLGRDEDAYKDFRFVARRNPEHLDAVREVRLHLIRARNKQKRSGVFARLFLR